jgi:hypothetical protein
MTSKLLSVIFMSWRVALRSAGLRRASSNVLKVCQFEIPELILHMGKQITVGQVVVTGYGVLMGGFLELMSEGLFLLTPWDSGSSTAVRH